MHSDNLKPVGYPVAWTLMMFGWSPARWTAHSYDQRTARAPIAVS